MLSIMALGHFWAILKKLLICQWYKRMYNWAKAPEIVKNEKLQCNQVIKTLMLRTANVAVTMVFVLGEKQVMKSYARNSDWS